MTTDRRAGVPSEDEVRALVSQIVDGVVEEAARTPAGIDDASRLDRGPTSPNPSSGGGPSSVVAIGADHGGFPLKERIGFRLRESGRTVIDVGTDSHESVDYPEFAKAVAERVSSGEAAAGIVIDGAGIGSAMVANKVPGVRASLCYDLSSARNAREHNHANVLTLGAGLVGEALAWQIVQTWLDTEWGEGRHARRVAMIDALDQQYSR